MENTYLTGHYKIENLVNAAYVNYTTRLKGINYALGLRFEHSYYKGILLDKNDSSFMYQYPTGLHNLGNALFPSLYISKKFNEKQEMQFNVSRKINRPNFFQLMPFIMASDPKNYNTGNPSLTPEFITLSELNFNQYVKKGNLFFSLFYKNTQNPITSISRVAASDSTILINTSINGKQSHTLGMDNTFKYTLLKGLEATLSMNLFYTYITAVVDNVNRKNEGFNYNGKLSFAYKLPKSISLQLSGSYESPRVIPQGKTKEFYFADFAISKDVYKVISITAMVSDIFDTKGRGFNYITPQYTQDSWNRRESRFFRVIVRIRFGKADATIFRKRPQGQSDDSDGGFF
jgi:outer membrane receptor for ferrienterochelin and colicin